MDDPKQFARVLARALRGEGGGGGAPPAAPPETATGGDDPPPWYHKWIYGVTERLDAHDTALEAVDSICGSYEAKLNELEARLAEIERRPVAKRVEHQRDASGKVLRSIVIDG